MPNLLPLEHLTFVSQVPAPKLMAKAHERPGDGDRTPAGKLPNYGRHRPTATPTTGSPHLMFNNLLSLSDTAARNIVHVQSTLASDRCYERRALKQRGMSRGTKCDIPPSSLS